MAAADDCRLCAGIPEIIWSACVKPAEEVTLGNKSNGLINKVNQDWN